MPRIDRILCPNDFSDASAHAFEHARVLAAWYDASIIGVHSYNPILVPVPGLDLPGYADVAESDTHEMARLRQDMAAWFQPALDAGVAVDIAIDTGPPHQVIVQTAKLSHADLIVMGTHGLTGFEYGLLGSVTEKVLRKAPCPVMTVPPRAHTTSVLPFKRLLCATDFSEPAQAALEFAFSIAREGDAALTILHVVDWGETEMPTVNTPFDVPEYKRAREAAARKELEQQVPADARDWCTPALRLEHGKPYRQVLEIAADEQSDLIVLGVHGRNPLGMLLFGSTANQVVRYATCPVLTVRR